ncbi:hypothetical protein JTB14_008525 [Gonioctena quinquepunctata]|nr:hypothetical protein JTB14_008525 [Gonioctena quinquepunctata]
MADDDLLTDNYLNVLSMYGFQSHVTDYTRVFGDSKSCIDHIFVIKDQKQFFEYKSLVCNLNITDHRSTILQINGSKSGRSNIKREFNKKYIDEKKLMNLIENENWLRVYNSNNLENSLKNS